MDDCAGPPGYIAPPAFAPPALRVAPLNELEVLGRTSYPAGPYAAPPVSAYVTAPAPWPYPSSAGAGNVGVSTSRRARSASIAVGAAVVAVLVTFGALLIGGNAGHSERSLSLPESAGNYTKVSTISGTQLHMLFMQSGAFANLGANDLDNAKVGVYALSTQSSPTMLFVGFSATDSPTIGRELRTEGPTEVANNVLQGAGGADPPLPVDAGPLGGAMQCGVLEVDGEAATAGVWADSDTLGIVLVVDPVNRPTTEQTADITRSVRAGAEH